MHEPNSKLRIDACHSTHILASVGNSNTNTVTRLHKYLAGVDALEDQDLLGHVVGSGTGVILDVDGVLGGVV